MKVLEFVDKYITRTNQRLDLLLLQKSFISDYIAHSEKVPTTEAAELQAKFASIEQEARILSDFIEDLTAIAQPRPIPAQEAFDRLLDFIRAQQPVLEQEIKEAGDDSLKAAAAKVKLDVFRAIELIAVNSLLLAGDATEEQ